MIKAEMLVWAQTDFIIISLDPTGKFLTVNPAAERLFHASQATLIGQPLHTVLDSYSYAKADHMIRLTLESGGVKDWEMDHAQPDSEPVLVGYTTCRLYDPEDHHLVGIGAVGRDLTEKLELTARLADTNQKLEGTLLQLEKAHAVLKSTQAQLLQSEKMRALGQMVAGVAHEINNPLGFVRNNIVYIAEKLPLLQSLYLEYARIINVGSPDQIRAITHVEQQAGIAGLWEDLGDALQESSAGIKRIQDIVLSLQNFSRLDEAESKEADLNQGLHSTINLVKAMCKDRISIEEDYGVIPTVFCHPGELNQVFLNLLTNAVQAIDGKGRIVVHTSSHGQAITILIKDSGKGMEAQTLAKLGEPFFTTKPVGSGVGLGLAVSFGIIGRHHGKLRFESKPGEGTTAMIELPVHSK